MRAIHAAERLVRLMKDDPPTAARFAQAQELLKALNAVRRVSLQPASRSSGLASSHRLVKTSAATPAWASADTSSRTYTFMPPLSP